MKFSLNYQILRKHQNNICFDLAESYPTNTGILGLFGPSGTGKTSLLKALAGLIANADYSIDIDGTTHTNLNAYENPCVYVGNEVLLFEHLDVLGNLHLVLKHSTTARANNKDKLINLDFVIQQCELKSLLKRHISALSSGEKQRVMFARALLCGKKNDFSDEAFSALDWPARLYFVELLNKLQQHYGFQFIIVSHSLKELAIACQHVWTLNEGKISTKNELNALLDRTYANSGQLDSTFSVLQINYLKTDELDEYLEIWELAEFGEEAAQNIVIRSVHKQADHHKIIGNKPHTANICIEADKISLSNSMLTQSSMPQLCPSSSNKHKGNRTNSILWGGYC